MQKRFNSRFISFFIISLIVIISFLIAYLIKIKKIYSEDNIKTLHGTFITEENQSPSAQYLVFDQSQHLLYYYDQVNLAFKDIYSPTDEKRVYISKIDNKDIVIFIKDNSHIIFMIDNVPHKYIRLSNHLEFIGPIAQHFFK